MSEFNGIKIPQKGLTLDFVDSTARNSMASAMTEFENIKTDFNTLQAYTETAVESISSNLDNRVRKGYLETSAPVKITDSEGGKVKELEIQGDTSQYTTKGKQILDIASATLSKCTLKNENDGQKITLTSTDTGYSLLKYALMDTAESDTVYYISFDSNTAKVQFVYTVDGSKKYKGLTDTSVSDSQVTIPQGATDVILGIYVNSSDEGTVGTSVTIKNLILSYTSGCSWEKYTGQVASPNPDYQQPIEIPNQVSVDILGKNLIDMSSFITFGGCTNYDISDNKISATIVGGRNKGLRNQLNFVHFNGKTITMSGKITTLVKGDTDIPRLIYVCATDSGSYKYYYYNIESVGTFSKTFNLIDNITDIRLELNLHDAGGNGEASENTITVTVEDLQVEYGTSATEFETASKQSVTIADLELSRFDKINQNGICKKSILKTIKGDKVYQLSDSEFYIDTLTNPKTNSLVICNKFLSTYAESGHNNNMFINWQGALRITYNATLEEMQSIIDEGIEVLYETAEESYSAIESDTLIALKELELSDSTNNVFVYDNNGNSLDNSFLYPADIFKALDECRQALSLSELEVKRLEDLSADATYENAWNSLYSLYSRLLTELTI